MKTLTTSSSTKQKLSY